MNHLTRPTRQRDRQRTQPPGRQRYDIVNGVYRIEPTRTTLRSAALYVAGTALLVAMGVLLVGYCLLLNGGM
jgi:hypothetical protein